MERFYLVSVILLAACKHAKMIIVTVNEGKLNGLVLPHDDIGQYYVFLGIPYAQPPIGALRFKAPQPVQPWQGVRNATIEGNICMQYNPLPGYYPPNQNENCLFLNIATPSLPNVTDTNNSTTNNKLLPVMFWIHGGAFAFGSGSMNTYGAYFLVVDDVIVVTINYRLDSLGFLNLGTRDVPGNAGLKDQNLALKWVKNNIINFGGDPERITIFGESAGSASVFYHLQSPMSRGLFVNAMGMSGVPFCEWAYTDRLKDRSFALGNLLGNSTKNPAEMLAFLQGVPAIKLINQFPTLNDREKNWNFGFKMTAFQPCPEEDFGQERFLNQSTIDALESGNFAQVPVFAGYTTQECLILIPEMIRDNLPKKYNDARDLFVPREVLIDGTNVTNIDYYVDKIYSYYFGDDPSVDITNVGALTQYLSDEVFVYSINRVLKYLVQILNEIFMYIDAVITPRNRFTIFGIPFGIKGVSHTDDFIYLFRSITDVAPSLIPNDIYRYIKQFVRLATNFAKYGNPTPPGSFNVTCPQYNVDTKPYLLINQTLSIGTNSDAAAVAFWTEIYKEAGIRLY